MKRRYKLDAQTDVRQLMADDTTNDKIYLVVYDNHTLGYVRPNSNTVGILHSSILMGAVFELHPSTKLLSQFEHISLASESDFERLRVSFEGFKNNPDYIHL